MTNLAFKLPDVSRPEALGYSRTDIEKLAVMVADQVGYEPGDDLFDLVEQMGGEVIYADHEGMTSGGSISIDEGGFEITLALDTGPLRDRFTIAHELGHYCLHYLFPNQNLGKNIKRLVAERYGAGAEEREANWFAAAFLMPESVYTEKFENLDGDHFALSREFGVSPQASTIRAKTLGLS